MTEKEELRRRVWDLLEDSGVARFPFLPHGRIPNFAGAGDAAERLRETLEWRSAEVVKANPDAPQLPVRRRALRDGKVVYMAVPRLEGERPFVELDPDELDEDDIDAAATVSSYSDHGRRVAPEVMEDVDLVVSGCVAVSGEGGRIGKGEGFSDLEWAVLREADVVDEDTVTATTVHPLQVVDAGFGTCDHDVPMEVVATPDEVFRSKVSGKPSGLDERLLEQSDLEEMSVLRDYL